MQLDIEGVKEVYTQVLGAKVWMQQAASEIAGIVFPEGFSEASLVSKTNNLIDENIGFINNVILVNIDSATSEILGAEYKNKSLLNNIKQDQIYLAKVLNDPTNYEGVRKRCESDYSN